MASRVSCPRCNVPMASLPERLDLSPAAGMASARDVPDLPFRGILAEVFQCPSCGGVGTRPASVRPAAAFARPVERVA